MRQDWLQDATNLGSLSEGGGRRTDCGVDVRRNGDGGVSFIPAFTPSLSAGDEAKGRDEKRDCLHLDAN